MLCSGDKTKLLIVCNRETRARKINAVNKHFQINVGGKVITETSEEKLLGMVMSDNMTWKTHIFGNNKSGKDKMQGLISQLSQRVGMISRLSKVMTRSQLSNTVSGIFTSKLLYGILLISNVWGIHDMDDTVRKSISFTKEDCRKFQVLQNKVLQIQTHTSDRNVPTKVFGRYIYSEKSRRK